MGKVISAVTFVACVLFCDGAFAATWYVDSSVAMSGNGTSWGTAFKTIQEGVATASDGDAVIVADGTYTTAEGPVDFHGKAITLRSQNGPAACILDCERRGRGFYLNSGEGRHSVVDGFTIVNGEAVFALPDEYGECGGAIVCDNSSPTITNCVFSENRAYMCGGAIFCRNSSPLASKCTFAGNRSEEACGGAIALFDGSNPTISDCTFNANEAAGGLGAGIYCLNSSATIANCLFRANTYEPIWCESSSVTIDRCAITNNKGDGVVSSEGGSVTITNSAIHGNLHAGVQCMSADVELINCTIVGSRRSSGVNYLGGTLVVRNCIVWENSGGSFAYPHGWTASITYSDIQGSIEGEGNVDAEPMFVALGHWDDAGTPDDDWDDVWVGADLRLQSGSPCVDVGENAAVPSSVLVDLDGNLRIANGIVDMGAYEFGSAPAPSRLYADAEAKGANAGTSWADAFSDLQDALYLAEKSGGAVREIWVADGTYRPSRRTDVDEPRSATFQLINGISIYGGFAGGEALLSLRKPAAYPTILTGDFNGDDGRNFSNNGENSYHVVTGNGTDGTAVLDGFIITGGNADAPPFMQHSSGGGVHIEGGGPTLRNCTIRGNVAYSDDPDSPANGGGVFSLQSTAILLNCTISGNRADFGYGGGIYCEQSDVTITNCTISDNKGGGIECRGSSPKITACTIRGNSAGFGAGINCEYGSSPAISNCSFAENSAGYDGGGLRCYINCSPALTNCTFIANRAVKQRGGGVFCFEDCAPTLTNCTFSGNSARLSGGAIGCLRNSSPTLTNCILWGDTAVEEGDEIAVLYYSSEGAPPSGSAITVSYSDVEGGAAGAYVEAGCTLNWGEGNIGSDPLFVDEGEWHDLGTPNDLSDDVWVDGDYRLQYRSPCIGVGNNSALPQWALVDLSGKPRVVSGAVDMGAYEFPSPVPPPTRLYVDADATGANNGTSWDDAFPDLQDALHLAASSAGVVREIWVAAGTYKPDRGTGDRQASFQLVNAVALYGGFAGGETELTQRHPSANETFLSGDLAGDDGPGFRNNQENSYHVVTGSDTDPTAVLDGFTVARGNANVDLEWHGHGGGMLNVQGAPTVVGCTFRGNAAMWGGGMCNADGEATVIHCTFIGNFADHHGGALVNRDCNPTVTQCTFIGNTAAWDGGAVWNYDNMPKFVNCLFSGNTAGEVGGAIANVDGGDYTFINCTFTNNSADLLGGAIRSDYWPILSNCILWGNHDSAGDGEISQVKAHYEPLAINYSCIQGWTGAWGGAGNIGTDPLFVNANGWDGIPGTEDDDLRLSRGSPCIDAGDNAALPLSVTTDLSSNPRFIDDPDTPDTGNGAPPIVDMGAYEFNAAFPSRLYVDADATGANNGLTWADAFTDLQDALNTAGETDGINCEIWVAAGTYRPSQRTDPSDPRSATFQLLNGATIYGGFAGGETGLGERNPALNETILSGDLAGNDVPDFANNDENAYHVVTGSGTDATAVLDGFTITGGNAGQYGQWPYLDGGGMYNANGSPTVANCTFRGNSVNGSGGGMANYDSSPSIINCTFVGNQAHSGAGVLFVGYSQPTVVNCRFFGDDLHSGRSSPTLTNCVFTGSRQATFFDTGSATFTNCTIAGNEMAVGIDGGAVARLTNCILWDNDTLTYDGCEPALDIRYSCVEGQAPQGPGNISPASAGFVDADGLDDIIGTEDDDLRLLPASPCIDSGDNSAIPPSVLTDLGGNPRIISGTVDMGAFEFQGGPWLIITSEGDVARLDWRQFGDGNYTVEWTDDMPSGVWQSPPGTWPIGELMWTDITSGAVVMRFYRVESGGIYTDPVGFVKVFPVNDGFTMVSVPLVPADNRLNGDPGCIGDMIAATLQGGPSAAEADGIWKWDASEQSYQMAYLLAGLGEAYDGRWWDDGVEDFSTMILDAGKCFWILRRPRTTASP